jgi:hypothetical protein
LHERVWNRDNSDEWEQVIRRSVRFNAVPFARRVSYSTMAAEYSTRSHNEQMTFEFVLRPGVSPKTNALKLLKFVGRTDGAQYPTRPLHC